MLIKYFKLWTFSFIAGRVNFQFCSDFFLLFPKQVLQSRNILKSDFRGLILISLLRPHDITWTAGFCICWSSEGMAALICSCKAGFPAKSGLLPIMFRAMSGLLANCCIIVWKEKKCFQRYPKAGRLSEGLPNFAREGVINISTQKRKNNGLVTS